ncbi:DUF4190 domain-containing protein [Nakamurella sp. YIM 132087]|uniref:DUF4190 domain-containing protein n=1 Tax=Nakamurella alba TaxID=2665158 RepID=A0A7K1FG18_9ACTN|nr:DUF4190 domain-containing protein [Nakamurella alba]
MTKGADPYAATAAAPEAYPGQPAYPPPGQPTYAAPGAYPGYGAPGHGYPGQHPGQYPGGYPMQPPPPGQRRNGMGTAALVLGIIGIVFDLGAFGMRNGSGGGAILIAGVLQILAIVFGAVGIGRARRGEATNRGAAVAGLVLGIVGLVLVLLLILLLAVFLSSFHLY